MLARSDRQIVRLTTPGGFTLVELLVVITIIGILAALLLGVAAVAAETGREAKTKQMITRLHTLLMEHYDSFQDRRVELNPNVVNYISSAPGNARFKGELTAEARLHGLRELQLTEMPDKWSDILLKDLPISLVNFSPSVTDDDVNAPAYLRQRSSLGELFLGLFDRIAKGTNTITGDPNTRQEILANQSAECLYMVIIYATGDGEARGLFSETDIADTDGDGAPEFVDAWGNPIEFLRWAPDCDSPLQLNQLSLALLREDAEDDDNEDEDGDQAVRRAISENRTAFDPWSFYLLPTLVDSTGLVNHAGYSLIPYIYSRGGDEESGLLDAVERSGVQNGTYVAWSPDGSPSFNYQLTNTPVLGRLRFARFPNCYELSGDGARATNWDVPIEMLKLGAVLNRAAAEDNLTNHYLVAE